MKSLPTHRTIDAIKILKSRFITSKEKICFTSLDDRNFSYGSYWHNAHQLAERLKAEGLKPGDVIAFILPNDISIPCCYLACAIGGFVACPIVDVLHSTMRCSLLKAIQPTLIIEELPVLDETLPPLDNVDFHISIDQDSPFIIFFTSGTTGEPKAIFQCLRGVIGSAKTFGHLTGLSEETRLYHILPMAYMAGFQNSMLAPFVAGGTIIEGPLFSPSVALDFWERPLRHKVNTLSIIPPIASALIRFTRSQEIIETVSSQIVQVQCTSAPIPDVLRKQFKYKFSMPLQDCYGITELGGPLTFQNEADSNSDYHFNLPIPEAEISLRGESSQKHLWVRSPYAMMGYFINGELIRPFDEDGFIDTGDLAIQVDGKLQITGREKDIIIRGGVNVHPARIESVLLEMDGVDEVAVVGKSHPFWGEQIVVCIVGNDSKPDLKEEVIKYCKESFAVHECPDQVRLLDQLPRNFIGKIQKNKL
jgi:acyl-CoA synthetase (AMP-forming)/AMP-acid ligase II